MPRSALHQVPAGVLYRHKCCLTGVRSAYTIARFWCLISLLAISCTVCQDVWCFPVYVRVGDLTEVLQKLFLPLGLTAAHACLPSSWAADNLQHP